MKRILFVDDEPNLLEGLKRILRPMKNEWDMDFVVGSKAALDLLGRNLFDVVVSDVQMPVMDGVQLLTKVKQRYPSTIRILLSGQSDRGTVMSTIGPAHQYLAKPCDVEVLKTAVLRSCMLSELLQNERCKQLVAQMDSIPSIPDLYMRLEKELALPDASMNRAAAIIAKDIGMTAKILKIVNSAFFGIPRQVSDLTQAVRFLGWEMVKTLVLTDQTFQQLSTKPVPGFSYEGFWSHSRSTADYARKIVIEEKGDLRMTQDAMAAGMLHDVGVLLLVSKLPKQYQEILAFAEREQCPLEDSELQVLGTTHAEIGAYLLGSWGLADAIVEAVAFHHRPSKGIGQGFCPLTAVHAANVLVSEKGDGFNEDGTEPMIDTEYLGPMNLAARVPVWRDLLEPSG